MAPLVNIAAIFYIIIGSVMLISIGKGYLQGLYKSIYNLVFTLLFWATFWITAPRMLSKERLFENPEVYDKLEKALTPFLRDSEGVDTLFGFFTRLFSEILKFDEAILLDPAVSNTVVAVSQGFLKILYLFLLAAQFSLLKNLIYYVIVRPFFKGKNKKRLWALLPSTLRGAVCVLLALSMFNSFFVLLPQVEPETEAAYDTTSLYDFILSYTDGDETVKGAVESIKRYQSSFLLNLTGIQIGGRRADRIFADSIIAGRSEDFSFSIQDELSLLIQIAEYACDMTNGFDMESVNFAALNQRQVRDVENILLCLADEALLQNLGTVVVGAALSMDAVKDLLPVKLHVAEYKHIDFKQELASVAKLVAAVYSLGDLSKLDYKALDPERVKHVMVSLSELQTINLLGHIGLSVGIRALVSENADYATELSAIETSLAKLALSDSFAMDIRSYSDLYGAFITLYNDKGLDSYKDAEGNITNYAAALTAVDVQKEQGIVTTILEANFITEILPNVMTILREELLPPAFASLVNPAVVQSAQWKNEINALLQIIADITTDENMVRHPFESMERYDFALLSGFSTETAVGSELLSYALIRVLIDAAEGEGSAIDVASEFSKYICMPDHLRGEAVLAADGSYCFDEGWYGTDGELYVMLDTIKNVARNIEDVTVVEGSIPLMLGAIDANQLMTSDLLYATTEHLLVSGAGEYIKIPTDSTGASLRADATTAMTFDGVARTDMITREELKKVLTVATDQNVINLDLLYDRYEVIDGTPAEAVTPKDEVRSDREYLKKFNPSTGNLIALLTSDQLLAVNEKTGMRENLDKLFSSRMLQATLTGMLTEQAGEYISIPKNAVETKIAVYQRDLETGERVTETMNIVKKTQFAALLAAIKELELDFATMAKEPLSAVDSLALYDEDGTFVALKDATKTIFGAGEGGKAHADYSGILHATLSKYILDLSKNAEGGVTVIVPDEVKDNENETPEENFPILISTDETLKLLTSVSVAGANVFREIGGEGNEWVEELLDRTYDQREALSSFILRATLTDYVDKNVADITVPKGSLDTAIRSASVITEEELGRLLDVTKRLFDNKINNVDMNAITVAELYTCKLEFTDSLLLRGVLTDKIRENGELKLPVTQLDGEGILLRGETATIIEALYAVLLPEATVGSIAPDQITVERLSGATDLISASDVLNANVTARFGDAGIVAPKEALKPEIPDEAGNPMRRLTDEEFAHIGQSLGDLFAPETKVTELHTDTLSCGKLNENKEQLDRSLVLRATITQKLPANLVIPTDALEADVSERMLVSEEFIGFLACLTPLFGADEVLENVYIDVLTCGELQGALSAIKESLVVRATVTSQLPTDLTIPGEALESTIDTKPLTLPEMTALIGSLPGLFGAETKISELNVDGLTCGKLYDTRATISESLILRATVTTRLPSDLTVPADALDATIDKKPLTLPEMTALIGSLPGLFGAETKISELNVDRLTCGKLYDTKAVISESLILRATVTTRLPADLTVPADALDVTIDKAPVLGVELLALIDSLYELFGENQLIHEIDAEHLTCGELQRAKETVVGSLILKATLTAQLPDGVTIPTEALDTAIDKDPVTSVELLALIQALYELFGAEQQLNTINTDDITYGKLNTAKAALLESLILKATVTAKLPADLTIPADVMRNDLSKPMVTDAELGALITCLSKLFGENERISMADANMLTCGQLQDAEAEIEHSYIMRATVTAKLPSTLTIPAEALDTAIDTQPMTISEMAAFVNAGVKLFGRNVKIPDLKADMLSLYTLSQAKYLLAESYILRATMTTQLLENEESVIVPSAVYLEVGGVYHETSKIIGKEETVDLITALCAVLSDAECMKPLEDISFSGILIADLADDANLEAIFASYILWASVSDEIKNNANLVIPASVFDGIYLIRTEFVSFFKAFAALNTGTIDSLDANTLTLPAPEVRATVLKSEIMRASVTDQVGKRNSELFAPKSSTAFIKDVHGQDALTVSSEELLLLFAVLDQKGIDVSLELQSFGLQMLLEMDAATMNAILDSNIARYRISDLVIETLENPLYAWLRSYFTETPLPESVIDLTYSLESEKPAYTKAQILSFVDAVKARVS